MELERIASDLLAPIWRGVDAAYKSKYRANIWQQFEDQIRSAAYTSRLGVCYDTLCRKLDVSIRAEHASLVQAVLMSGEDRAILKALRDETTLLVLLVRVANEERKAEFEANQASLF